MSRPIPPTYKTRNWPAYNEALKRRGSLTIWFDPEMSWDAAPTGRRGRQQTYSDAAIQTCLSMKVLFGMALRQMTGFVESLLRLVGLNWTVPDFSTLSRRQKTLAVNIPYRGSKGPLHLLVDSTGIKVEGEGEWHARKHGGPKRRVWRKLHLGIDEETLEIRAVEVTGSHIGDAPILPHLLDQIPRGQEIGSVTADGAYDTHKCHDAIADRGAHAVIPPRKNAKPWKTITAGAVARNEALRAAKYLGRALWRRWRWDGCRPPQTASRCAKVVVFNATQRRGRQMKDTMIGVDLAKNIFQLHGASMTGLVKFRKKVTRSQFRQFMIGHAPAVVVMEACGSASYWAREFAKLGHEVKLIAPQYVRPFVKRQKNDAADAEAIVIAAQRPEMRFVEPKSEAQQAQAVLFRARERLVRQRTELVNALRGVLYEFGQSIPQGISQLKRIEAILKDPSSDLPAIVHEECRDLLEQIVEKTARIDVKTAKAKLLAEQADTARRLQTMPGVGPLTSLAIEAFAPDMASFRRGRDFAAWLGLVPRQYSSGGKDRLGRMSKAGQADIRRLLIIGAMSRMNWLGAGQLQKGHGSPE